MTHFSDDLFIGNAPNTPQDPLALAPLGPTPGRGVGPVGRIYVWDAVPPALDADALAASQTPAGAGNLTLTIGTDVTVGLSGRGETVRVIGTPRALSVFHTIGGAAQTFTITGYDVYGQRMSEAILSVPNSTVNGQKAFKQVLSIAVSGATTTAITVGTTDILGVPVRVPDRGYASPRWNNVLAQDAGTLAVADQTNPATTTTDDVRGTYLPSNAADGVKRLVMFIALPALAAGPTATRTGAYGVDQNLAAS